MRSSSHNPHPDGREFFDAFAGKTAVKVSKNLLSYGQADQFCHNYPSTLVSE